jgi:hypothetical protein
VKKLLVLGLMAAGVAAVVQRIRAEQAEQDLWAEATDPVT